MNFLRNSKLDSNIHCLRYNNYPPTHCFNIYNNSNNQGYKLNNNNSLYSNNTSNNNNKFDTLKSYYSSNNSNNIKYVNNNNSSSLFNNSNSFRIDSLVSRNYSTHTNEDAAVVKKTTILDIKKKYKQSIPISMVTAYDYCSAKEVDKAGIDITLVGDSLGMVMLGDKGTTNVTMDAMIHHCKAVMRGTQRSFVVGDMPFGSFETSPRDALHNAIRLMKEGGVDAVKLEGGAKMKDTIREIVRAGIPVVGHIGLTPQTVSSFGGFKLQGKTSDEALSILEDAMALQEAGCFSIVIEMVPQLVGEMITKHLSIPTIGIGAGSGTSGQVLVYHDMLGLYSDFMPKFCKQYASLSSTIHEGLKNFKKEIEQRQFPTPQHSFTMKEEESKKFINILNSNNNSNNNNNGTDENLYSKSQYLNNSDNIKEKLKELKEKEKEIESLKIASTKTAKSITEQQQLQKPKQQTLKIETERFFLTPNGIKRPKIVVIGAGAMGSFFSAKLAAKDFADVWMVSAWKEHVDRINNNGLTLYNLEGKSESITSVRATLDALDNGVGNREEIETTINEKGFKNKVWQGVTSNGAVMAGAGSVRHTGSGLTYLASPSLAGLMMAGNNNNNGHYQNHPTTLDNEPKTLEEKRALEALGEILNEAGIVSELTYDVDALVWSKVVVNAAINPLSAVLGVPNGYLVQDEYSKNLMKKIIVEGMEVCKAKGIKLPYGEDTEEGFKYVANIAERTSTNYSSMLVDVIRGQPTEIKSINGVIVKEGERLDMMYQLTKDQIDLFTNNGYVIINEFFEARLLDNIFVDVKTKLDQLIALLLENKKVVDVNGEIAKDTDLDRKIISLDSQFKGTSIMLHTMFAGHLCRSFGSLFSNERLLDVIQQLLGTAEISGHPEWNLRVKTPNNTSFEVPWHQDAAYLVEGAESLDQITCWIPLIDITESNGALQLLATQSDSSNNIIPHRLQRLKGGDLKDSWYLEILRDQLPPDYQNIVVDTIGLKRGSIVLFKNTTCHQSLPNTTQRIRWTVDLRFQKTKDPSGFYPLDQSDNESKMALRSAEQRSIPIDYSKWDGEVDILMKKDNDNNNQDKLNYQIEGPWFDRWSSK
ncbi:3-methyl-2-oxobutanoate hydroxymethyltransferase [Heterostelium album PN500]|uniref:3-methyl-2-oxobutanoate hydroxymethyltransferase n=1 Tax=Heterostelium pallidum (strain ATCC 26659 / Pp 5 / PN500) TaxID=670386 RepID=D3AXV1_HETP5|nr:3-methyl-2-oxobutanoate hydroxymethyltransferase [Heterostelium album PN500]EFA85778.1 3-methyl-2-oxobutanoate hydroxymethyltransferase [Heterostelium album PN500]|eukprot:XP_020437884.1 3-methyl-2-oxobutanoate hydroxymethyltransferase [Heterostelium album PN500]